MSKKFSTHLFGNGQDGFEKPSSPQSYMVPKFFKSLIVEDVTVSAGLSPIFCQDILHIAGTGAITANGDFGSVGGASLGNRIFSCQGDGGQTSINAPGDAGDSPFGEGRLGGSGGGGGAAAFSGGSGGSGAFFNDSDYGTREGAILGAVSSLLLSRNTGSANVFDFFGGGCGGGGGGGIPDFPGGVGGGGGGIIWLVANTIVIGTDATIAADGGNGEDGPSVGGGGGGGGGGAIVFVCNNLLRETPAGGTITANGGLGGSSASTPGTQGSPGNIHIFTPGKTRTFSGQWTGTKI